MFWDDQNSIGIESLEEFLKIFALHEFEDITDKKICEEINSLSISTEFINEFKEITKIFKKNKVTFYWV